MIEREGHYWIPILPAEMRAELDKLPSDRASWPADFQAEYSRLRSQFTKAKAEFLSWVRKDRDSRMKGNAKAILTYLVDCLNFETGRCDPSHQAIADEVGLSLRTVERMTVGIREAGWIDVIRRGKTTTNFYRMRVSIEKIHSLLEYVDGLRDQRAEERAKRREYNHGVSDPTELSDHSAGDPTTVRSHDPTELADHDPTELAGKHMNRTMEGEHLNESSCSDGREDTYPRERIPTDEHLFNAWVSRNIPDRSKHREALRLLSERKMTNDVLREMAA